MGDSRKRGGFCLRRGQDGYRTRKQYFQTLHTTDNLLEAINTALLAGGKDPESLNAEDLKGVDEFQPDF